MEFMMLKKPDWLIFQEEIMAGYTWGNIFNLMLENKAHVSPRYIPRFGYALAIVSFTTPFRILQKYKLKKIVSNIKLKHDPVFVMGNYRTGTTYMITTLSKDPNRAFTSNLLAYTFPFYFTLPSLSRKIVVSSLPEKRPMDNVLLSADEPTEEEYCLGSFSKYGYYHGMVFPQAFRKMAKYHSFKGLPDDEKQWKKDYDYVIRSLTYLADGKQLFLKNPAIAFRIKPVLDLYPNAKFIHTYRNPYTLYASNIHYYKKVLPIYTLQNYTDEMLKEEILSLYEEHIKCFEESKQLIPPKNLVEIRYEDYIADPMPVMKSIYDQFELTGWDKAAVEFQKHFEKQLSYKTNKFKIADEVIETVNNRWDHIRALHGYERLEVGLK